MEERLGVEQKSRFPLYRQLMWHTANYFHRKLASEGDKLGSPTLIDKNNHNKSPEQIHSKEAVERANQKSLNVAKQKIEVFERRTKTWEEAVVKLILKSWGWLRHF